MYRDDALLERDAAVEVTDNRAKSRYEIFVGGELAGFATYRVADGAVVFLTTAVDSSHRGVGLGHRLIAHAVDDVRAQGREVVALCPFVAGYISPHPEQSG
jgi:predicted GNAT family acetyltransferase